MKNQFLLKKTVLFLSLFCLFISCEKAEPEPPLADQIAGNYTATSYKAGTTTVNLPSTNNLGVTATGKVSVTKISDEVASFLFTFILTKAGVPANSTSKLDNVSLKKVDTGTIDGYNGTSKDVSFKNNELILTFTNADPTKVIILYAKKDL